jgi:hypothetical protein
MAQLTFPIRARELHVDVRINLCAPDLALIHGNRQPAPAAVATRAALDTGSNVSGVSATVLQQLALASHAKSSTLGDRWFRSGETVPNLAERL